jgi:hypothetical protein
VAEIVERCPSGALLYRRLDGGEQEARRGTKVTPAAVACRPRSDRGPLLRPDADPGTRFREHCPRPLAAAGCRRRAGGCGGGCRCRRHRRRRHATHPRPDGALPRALRGRDRLLRGAPQSVRRRPCLRRAICGRPEATAGPGLPGALTDRRLLLSRRYADLDSLTLATSRSHGGIPAGGKETRPWSRAVRCSAVPALDPALVLGRKGPPSGDPFPGDLSNQAGCGWVLTAGCVWRSKRV